MKYPLTIFIFLIAFCSCNPKIDLNNYLQGGVWCGYSELSEGEICIEFLEKDAYLKVKRERFINPIPYVVHKIDKGKKIAEKKYSNTFFLFSKALIIKIFA